MKLTEVMIIRNDGLKLFQVDDSTIAKLTRIRGNFYRDDPRLRVVKDLPTPEPEISPEMRKRAEESWRLQCVMQAAGERATTVTPAQPQPERPKPEEEWRTSPALRAEFGGNLASYLAYCKAAESGRCRVYGGVS